MAGRGRRAKEQETVAPNSLIASAVQLSGMGTKAGRAAKNNKGTAWYTQGWYFYDTIGEFRFAVNWVGNILSRAKLYVARQTADKTWEPVTGIAQELLDRLVEGAGGQSEMLQRFGVLLSVPGDSYLLGWTEQNRDMWAVASPSEVSFTPGGTRSPAGTWKLNEANLPSSATGVRIWRQHPNDRRLADSPTRAALPILSQIDQLTKHVSAEVDSRLAGAGILFVPDEMRFPSDEEGNASIDSFVEMLGEAMQAPIADRSSASAVVPLVLQAPGDLLDKIKHMTFWSPLDEHSMELRTEAIRRLALSMDMPPEVLTGIGDVNHWQAWAIDESAIKVHAMPPLQLIVSSLTVGYLWPNLEAANIADPMSYAILADTSQMRTRPNRSREALELSDRHKISDKALLREVGFEIDDAMDEEGLRKSLLIKVASGSATPEQVQAALTVLGVDLNVQDEQGDTREARPDPSLEDHPDQGPPDNGMLALAEPLVFRALERAGNRIRNKMQRNSHRLSPKVLVMDTYLYRAAEAAEIDELLSDAWEPIPRLCAGRGIKPDDLIQVLDSYCRVLLTERKPHDRELLSSYLGLLSQAVA